MGRFTLHNAIVVNAGAELHGGVTVDASGMIERVFHEAEYVPEANSVDAGGAYLLPGAIDSHVHFREPGLTHKGDVASESLAAVAGGVTSYMDMPNTKPATLSNAAIHQRIRLAEGRSYANYAFHLGASSSNIDEIRRADPTVVPAVKVFLGASTGNMQVERSALQPIFSAATLPILSHCESDAIVSCNLTRAKTRYGDAIPFREHAAIRSAEACLDSVKLAVDLARACDARLHILHISSALETSYLAQLFARGETRVSAETCPHYFTFTADDYARFEGGIKCNPSIKYPSDQAAVIDGLSNGTFLTIGTDHAPHLLEEKQSVYTRCPSGIPSIQYGLVAAMELVAKKRIKVTDVARLYAHAPAELFCVKNRGFLTPGYYADLVLLKKHSSIQKGFHFLGKCGWSPYEEVSFSYKVASTYVNGVLAWDGERVCSAPHGRALQFKRTR